MGSLLRARVDPFEFLYIKPAYERIFERSVDSLLREPLVIPRRRPPDDRERVEGTVHGAEPSASTRDGEVPGSSPRWNRPVDSRIASHS